MINKVRKSKTQSLLAIVLLGLIALIVFPSAGIAGVVPRLVYGSVVDSSDVAVPEANITFKAILGTDTPQTEDSLGCGIIGNKIYFNLGNFESNWAVGETLEVIITSPTESMTKSVSILAGSGDWDLGEIKLGAAPNVISTTPANNSVVASAVTSIIVEFSVAMATDTATSALTLVPAATVSTVAVSDKTVTFTLDSLAEGEHTATLDKSIKSATGVALSATDNYEWTFTIDTTKPAIDKTAGKITPADAANDVAIDITNIKATFNEKLDTTVPITGTCVLTPTSGTQVTCIFSSFDSDTEVTFSLGGTKLVGNITYTVDISGFKDLAGNEMVGGDPDPDSWTFTTKETDEPYITTLAPENKAIDQSLTPTVSATFDGAMDESSLTDQFTLYELDGMGDHVGNNLISSVTYSDKIATFVFDALKNATTYEATVLGSVKDLAGNEMGIAKTWTFTTAYADPSDISVEPAFGSTVGGETVTIKGKNFVGGEGSEVKFGGSTASCAFWNDTEISCTTPKHDAGPVDIVVTNSNVAGNGTGTGVFTYQAGPKINSLLPRSGAKNGNYEVIINGTDFDSNATVTFGGKDVTSLIVTTDKITCTTIPTGDGSATVIVTNPDTGYSDTNNFTYTDGAGATIIDVNPKHAPANLTGITVTITGTKFQTDNVVKVYFGSEEATNVVIKSETELTCTSPANQSVGVVDVILTDGTDELISLIGMFQYIAAPTIDLLKPAIGSYTGGTSVVITGTGFLEGATVTFGSVRAGSIVRSGSTSILCTSPGNSIGAENVEVVVTNTFDGQKSNAKIFTYTGNPAPPPSCTTPLTLVVSPVDSGSLRPTGTLRYCLGTVVYLQAQAASGFKFDHWSSNVDSEATYETTTVTMNAAKTVTAYFVCDGEDCDEKQYTLTMKADPSDGGTTTPPVGDQKYDYGTVVNISAESTANYVFDKWEGDVDVTASTVTMTADKTVTAIFKEIDPEITKILTVSVNPNEGGTTNIIGEKAYDKDEVVTLSALANTGYTFDKWTGDVEADVADSFTLTITMDDDKQVTANFKNDDIVTYDLTAIVSGSGGTITPDSMTVNEGGSASFTITPADGYEIDTLTDNGSAVTASNNVYALSNINGIHAIVVTFKAQPVKPTAPTVTVTVDGTFSISASGVVATIEWTLSDASGVVYSGSTTGNLSLPRLYLSEGQTYTMSTIYVDDQGNRSDPASTPYTVPTPTTGSDANGDGVPDTQAASGSAVSYGMPEQTLVVDSVVSDGVIGVDATTSGAQVKALESIDSGRSDMPSGLIGFNVKTTQGTVKVDVYFDQPIKVEGAKWYRYNKDGVLEEDTSAVFSDDGKKVTLTLTDGGTYDADGVANGSIVEQSGHVGELQSSGGGGSSSGSCFISTLGGLQGAGLPLFFMFLVSGFILIRDRLRK